MDYLPSIFSAIGSAIAVGIPAIVVLRTSETRADKKYVAREDLLYKRTEALIERQDSDMKACRDELKEVRRDLEARIDKYEDRVEALKMILIQEGHGSAIPKEIL